MVKLWLLVKKLIKINRQLPEISVFVTTILQLVPCNIAVCCSIHFSLSMFTNLRSIRPDL